MNKRPGNHARYLWTLACTMACGIALVTATIVVVDPYGLYRLVERPGFNLVKPGLTRHQEAIKLANAVALQPQVVILGNSRAEIGFDPAMLGAGGHPGPGYNLAIPGSGLVSSDRELQHLHAAGIKPSTVIVGLEFLDFVGRANSTPAPPRTDVAQHQPETGMAFWRFDTLFSLASLKDAIRTVRIQRDGEAVSIAPNGFNPFNEYRAHARNDGYHVLFRQAAQASLASMRKKAPAAVLPEDLAYLRSILTVSARSGADVRLVIYPYHAQMLVMFEQAGLWPLFEQWKIQVVDEIAAVRRLHPAARITLVDFSGFSEYQCEPVPGKRERHMATRWYWEAGHFKKELGALVLERLMSARDTDAEDARLGMVLDTARLARNAGRIAAERARCAREHPEMFLSVQQLAGQ